MKNLTLDQSKIKAGEAMTRDTSGTGMSILVVDEDHLNEITKTVIGCAYIVSNRLGAGFLEKIYENALAHELRKTRLKVGQQFPITVWYDGVPVGEFIADLIVEDCVLAELKSVKSLEDLHLAQCMNYLKATGLKLCLLINFYQPKVQIRRIVSGMEERPKEQISLKPGSIQS